MVFSKGNKPWNIGKKYKRAANGHGISYYYKNRDDIKKRVTRQKRERKERIAGRPKPDICEICSSGGRIMFDHDHATGLFRGWICSHCNWILGLVKDNPHTLWLLREYLERTKSPALSQVPLNK